MSGRYGLGVPHAREKKRSVGISEFGSGVSNPGEAALTPVIVSGGDPRCALPLLCRQGQCVLSGSDAGVSLEAFNCRFETPRAIEWHSTQLQTVESPHGGDSFPTKYIKSRIISYRKTQ